MKHLNLGVRIAIIMPLLLSFFNLQSQDFVFAKNWGGNQHDRGNAVACDLSGNVYTTGFFDDVADLDPGPATYSVITNGNQDIFINKLDASGNFIWGRTFGGSSIDMGRAIATDAAGNVYATGSFIGTVDFDPGAGVVNLVSAGTRDIFVVKLSPSGNLVWAKQMGGSSTDEGYGITVDASGNVYTTGFFNSTADFDPGAGTYTLSAGNDNAFVSKLDASGNFVWAVKFAAVTGSPQIHAYAIKLDGSSDLLIGGSFTGQVDFDPSVATNSLTAINGDLYICKLTAAGNFVWVKTAGGTNGSNIVHAIDCDASGNVYATGYFDGSTDFDPGPGTANLSSAGQTDIFILKLNANGNYQWAKSMGSVQGDQGRGLSVSPAGDVYTTGIYANGADFDPGMPTYTLSTLGGQAVFISRLDGSGNFVSAKGFGFSSSSGNGIAVNQWYQIYTVGNFDQPTDFDPGTSTYTLAPAGIGSSDAFLHKMEQAVCPNYTISAVNGNTLMCAINSLTFNAVNTTTISGVTYTWNGNSSPSFIGASFTATAAGIYTVSSSAPSYSCIVTQTLSVVQSTGNVSFTVGVNPPTCLSNGSATVTTLTGTPPFTYSWSTSGTSSVVTNIGVGTHTVSVTDANQCVHTSTINVVNGALSYSSIPICYVSVDSLSQYNVITWEKSGLTGIDSFFVYREITTNNFQPICKQAFSAFSQFKDTVQTLYFPNTGNPNVGTYRYKLKMKDTCGNMSDFSPYHNTIFITSNNNGTFSWPQLYSIEGQANPVIAYILERDDLSNGNWTPVGSVAGTQSFIVDPAFSTWSVTATWRVKTQWNVSCLPSKGVAGNVSFSNHVGGVVSGINAFDSDSHLSIFPNPSYGEVNIRVNKLGIGKVELIKSDGGLMYSLQHDFSDNTKVSLRDLAAGIYFIKVSAESRVYTQKIIVQP